MGCKQDAKPALPATTAHVTTPSSAKVVAAAPVPAGNALAAPSANGNAPPAHGCGTRQNLFAGVDIIDRDLAAILAAMPVANDVQLRVKANVGGYVARFRAAIILDPPSPNSLVMAQLGRFSTVIAEYDASAAQQIAKEVDGVVERAADCIVGPSVAAPTPAGARKQSFDERSDAILSTYTDDELRAMLKK